MTLLQSDHVLISRSPHIITASFTRPHRVVSTGRINGGLREDIKVIGNCQICEPRDHMPPGNSLALKDAKSYHSALCGDFGIEPGTSLLLLTAADMHNAALMEEQSGSVSLRLVCTAGVESNAARAGDPAPLEEGENGFHAYGTINLIVCIDSPLSPGAHIQALITAAEGKAAALQELLVPSRYSGNPATGTGTDGIAIACLLEGPKPLTDAGTHTRLGELIGASVKKGIKQALALQNSLTPDSVRNIGRHAVRTGMEEKGFIDSVCRLLEPEEAAVFRANAKEVITSPMIFAAFSALVHCLDLHTCGVLPGSHLRELLVRSAAQLAASVSGDDASYPEYLTELDAFAGGFQNNTDVVQLAAGLSQKAVAAGYQRRWKR